MGPSTPPAADPPPEAIPGYRVQLDHYYGPMDLLLHLVQQHELDIFEIPIARVADQYIRYIETLQKHDINISGEFLSMASYLMVLKSRALMPREGPEEEVGEEEGEGSLADLIKRLLEFRRVKDRSLELSWRWDQMAARAPRPDTEIEVDRSLEIPQEVEVWDLVVAYAKLAERITLRVPMTILFTELPIEHFILQILETLKATAQVAFSALVGDRNDRGRVIGTFLAMLELMKQQKVTTEQTAPGAEIVITRRIE